MVNPNTLGAILGIFEWWQIIPLIALVGILIFWKKYRDKQL
jgi:hypothetical protein